MPTKLIMNIRRLLGFDRPAETSLARVAPGTRFREAESESAPRARPRPAGQPVAIQPLEGRRLFQVGHAGPLINEQIIGPDSAATAVVLTFNEPLDPTTANNVNAYGIGRTIAETSGGNTPSLIRFSAAAAPTQTSSTCASR